MLDEQRVDRHLGFVLGRHLRHAAPKPHLHCGDALARVREVHLERRIGDHVIELAQLLAVITFMVGTDERVALHGMVKRGHQAIEDEIQLKHLVAAL